MMERQDLQLQRDIEAEMVNSYMRMSRIAVYSAIPVVPYLGLSYYGEIETYRIVLWMLAVWGMDILVLFTSSQYRPDFSQEKIYFFKKRQELFHLLAGMTWGSCVFLLLNWQLRGIEVYRVMTCLGIVMAFSASTMSASIKGLAGFMLFPAVLIMIFCFVDIQYYLWWAIGDIAVVVVVIVFGRMTHQLIREQIENRFLSKHYSVELQALNAKMEQSNLDLKARNQALIEVQARLEKLTTHDELTGLYNRRYILQRLNERLVEAKRYQHSCCVAMMDVDFFKRVNDQYGHAAGDEVLSTLGSLLKHEMRQGDLVARYGGEEFLIVLPMTELASAQLLLERLREDIAHYPYYLDGQVINVTTSFGLAGMLPNDEAEKMIARADKALLEAKRKGRNCVIVYSS